MQSKSPEEKERINKLKGITLENMIRKWGEVDGTEKYNIYINKRNNLYSDISQELFFEILKYIKDKQNVKYATHNKEKVIKYKEKNYFYDFCYNKKIIEFNGDLWHANPKIYNENDCPNIFNRNITAKQIWEKDNIKNNIAKNKNYDVFVIWEKDYNENKQLILVQCLIFLNLTYEK
jgi:hypothetical protein